jgi:RimJ/RimL family protein N-acetyltransferase
MRVTSFATDRLVLRPFKDDDVLLMQRLDSDGEVVRYLGNGQIKSSEESAKNLVKILKDYQTYGLGLFAVYEKGTQQFVGRSGLIPWLIDGVLTWEIGYSLIRDAWGKGYASELAQTLAKWAPANLGVSHVISLIHPQNRASIHVAKKIGMSFSKTIRLGELELAVYRLGFSP